MHTVCTGVECVDKGKARKTYESKVKVSTTVTYKSGLIADAGNFPDNPIMRDKQLEQTRMLLEGALTPKQVIADLGFFGVDADNPEMGIIRRDKRQQILEPAIRHLISSQRMGRCWLPGTAHAMWLQTAPVLAD